MITARDRERLRHILDAIESIEQHRTSGAGAFTINRATIYELVIIGEAVRHLSDAFKASYTHVPWKRITGARNIFVHEYDGIDYDAVYRIIEQYLPDLRVQVEDIIRNLES